MPRYSGRRYSSRGRWTSWNWPKIRKCLSCLVYLLVLDYVAIYLSRDKYIEITQPYDDLGNPNLFYQHYPGHYHDQPDLIDQNTSTLVTGINENSNDVTASNINYSHNDDYPISSQNINTYSSITHNCTSNNYNYSCNSNPVRTVVATIAFYKNLKENIIFNHRSYTQRHNYDYFVLRRRLFDYDRKSLATHQRALLIWNLLYNKSFETNVETKTTYSRVLWIDFDAIFLNDSIKIDEIINYSYNSNFIPFEKRNDISLILTGDWNHVINAGVLIFQKNDFTEHLLLLWHQLMNLCNYISQLRNENKAPYSNKSKKPKKKKKKTNYQKNKLTKNIYHDDDEGVALSITQLQQEERDLWLKFKKSKNKLKNSNRNVQKVCKLNDQLSLAMMLFQGKISKLNNIDTTQNGNDGNVNTNININININITDGAGYNNSRGTIITTPQARNSVSSFVNVGTNILGSNLNKLRMLRIFFLQDMKVFGDKIYDQQGAVREQSLWIRNELLSSEFFNHVLWIQQSKMNANIWSIFRNKTPFGNWILHLAGQNSKNKNQLLQLFIRCKFIINDFKESKKKKAQAKYDLQTNVKKYVKGAARGKNKANLFLQSGKSYNEFISMVTNYSHVNESYMNCNYKSMKNLPT